MDAEKKPDQLAFETDIAAEAFVVGVIGGQWEVLSQNWPEVIAWIAPAQRQDGPDRLFVRLICDGYPNKSPTGIFWNLEKNAPLDLKEWPKGRARVKQVFRTDWEAGCAFYHPYDSFAAQKHPEWPSKHPTKIWTRDKTISHWFAEFHELLNCDEYTGL